jgi:uncharacterized membrane protein
MARTELTIEERHARELQKARGRGKMVGWLQGAAVTAVGFLAWRFIGLIPLIAVSALAIWIVYRLVFGGTSEPE